VRLAPLNAKQSSPPSHAAPRSAFTATEPGAYSRVLAVFPTECDRGRGVLLKLLRLAKGCAAYSAEVDSRSSITRHRHCPALRFSTLQLAPDKHL
jgi:hypothetical protein